MNRAQRRAGPGPRRGPLTGWESHRHWENCWMNPNTGERRLRFRLRSVRLFYFLVPGQKSNVIKIPLNDFNSSFETFLVQ